jgi:hypothetical protein
MDVLQNLISWIAVFQSPSRAEIAMPQGANLKDLEIVASHPTP